MLAAAFPLDARGVGDVLAHAGDLCVEIAKGVEAVERTAGRVALRIVVLEGRGGGSDLRKPVTGPHRPAERLVGLRLEMARVELHGHVEIERPLVERGGVRRRDEPVVDFG